MSAVSICTKDWPKVSAWLYDVRVSFSSHNEKFPRDIPAHCDTAASRFYTRGELQQCHTTRGDKWEREVYVSTSKGTRRRWLGMQYPPAHLPHSLCSFVWSYLIEFRAAGPIWTMTNNLPFPITECSNINKNLDCIFDCCSDAVAREDYNVATLLSTHSFSLCATIPSDR
jgi:hypothetical protein